MVDVMFVKTCKFKFDDGKEVSVHYALVNDIDRDCERPIIVKCTDSVKDVGSYSVNSKWDLRYDAFQRLAY